MYLCDHYIYLHSYFYWYSYFFICFTYCLETFYFILKISFSISFKTSLLVMSSSTFFKSCNVLLSLLFLKVSLLNIYWYYWLTVIFFPHYEYICHLTLCSPWFQMRSQLLILLRTLSTLCFAFLLLLSRFFFVVVVLSTEWLWCI